MLSSLSHRNIIQFFGAVTIAPNFCIVTGTVELQYNGSQYSEHLSIANAAKIIVARAKNETRIKLNLNTKQWYLSVCYSDVLLYYMILKICPHPFPVILTDVCSGMVQEGETYHRLPMECKQFCCELVGWGGVGGGMVRMNAVLALHRDLNELIGCLF